MNRRLVRGLLVSAAVLLEGVVIGGPAARAFLHERELLARAEALGKAKLEGDLRSFSDDTAPLTADAYDIHYNRLKAYLLAYHREQLDAGLVARVRDRLKRMPLVDRDYSALVRDANESVPPITRTSVFAGSTFSTYVASKADPELFVRGAYTKAGYDAFVRDHLEDDRLQGRIGERWVLDEPGDSAGRTHEQLDALRERYFTSYIRAWSDFLKDLDVRQPPTYDEALEELSALTERPWPYQRLLRTLDENTRLDGGETPVEPKFRAMAAMPLAPYQEIVSRVVAHLTERHDARARGQTLDQVDRGFDDAVRDANALVSGSQDAFTRPLVSALLLNPFELAVYFPSRGREGGDWEGGVWKTWDRDLEDAYPFTDTWRDVKLSDYAAFFKPGGLLLGFEDERLRDDLELRGDRFVPTLRLKQSSSFTSAFLACLDRGLAISRATFDDEHPDSPRVDFALNLHATSANVSEVVIEVDGESTTFRNVPDPWLSISWPSARAGDHGARITVRGASGLDEENVRPGEWGWFRLLDAARTVDRGPGGTVVATWSLHTQPGFVALAIKPSRENNPFDAYLTRKGRMFRGYECPRVISKAGRGL